MSRSAVCAMLLCVLLGCAQATGSAQQHVPLRVMTYNIQAGAGADGNFDLERTAAAINARSPDVVGLQEVDRHWSARSRFVDEPAELARRTGMHAFFAPIYSLPPPRAGAPRREFGVALLTRGPIVSAHNRMITRRSSQTPDAKPKPGPGFAQVLTLQHGRPMRVYVTHLDFRADPSVRAAQVADMRAVMRHAPGVLMGDFNTDPDAPELAPLHRRLHDAWTGPRGYTFPVENPDRRIDQVLLPPRHTVARVHVPHTDAADHLPVVVDLRR